MTAALFDLTGKNALVTGSSRGLGLSFARALRSAGAAVILNGRNPETLEEARVALGNQGPAVHTRAFDITDGTAADKAIAAIESAIGPLDILVNNAGIQQRAPLDKMDEQQWRAVIDTNLTGAFLVARAVAGYMIGRKRGKIINICSLMSEAARTATGNYAAAKGGLKMLTKAMSTEWAAHNIQVNGIGPGYFKTEITRPLYEDPDFDRWLRARTPAGRWGEPDELAGAAIFLASPAADFVSGQIIYVDGGLISAL